MNKYMTSMLCSLFLLPLFTHSLPSITITIPPSLSKVAVITGKGIIATTYAYLFYTSAKILAGEYENVQSEPFWQWRCKGKFLRFLGFTLACSYVSFAALASATHNYKELMHDQ